MPPKFDNEQIARGRILRDMVAGGHPLLSQLCLMIAEEQDMVLTFRNGGPGGHVVLPTFLGRFQALQELRQWIDDEIDAGGKELIRKNEFEARQPEKGPLDASLLTPTGQSGE